MCGTAFTTGFKSASFCSVSCKGEYSRGEHFLKHRSKVSASVRRLVYVRDGGICHLCGKPVDFGKRSPNQESPSLDHIIPYSAQLVPDNGADNLRLAHLGCNVRRGARLLSELEAVAA